jgi:Bacterial signalling protein N terminal repeat
MGVAVSGMHYVGMAAMHVFRSTGPSGMIMGGPGGATAESFLLPLILGIAVISFALTATIALSASADELRYDAALMDRIQSGRARPRLGSAWFGAAEQVGALFVGFGAAELVAFRPGAAEQIVTWLGPAENVVSWFGAAEQVGALFVGFRAAQHARVRGVRHDSLLSAFPPRCPAGRARTPSGR